MTFEGRTRVVDRAARWAHELADVERVITEKRGERNASHVGTPLHKVVANLLDETREDARYWGGIDMADRITPDLLARAMTAPEAGEPRLATRLLAERTHARLADLLGWAP